MSSKPDIVAEPSGGARYPVGAGVRDVNLRPDPYPIYRALQVHEPVSWIDSLGMWWVVGHDHVREILMDAAAFTTASEHSMVQATFGAQMLSVEGETHERYKRPARPAFQARALRDALETDIGRAADQLIDGFADDGVDLRAAFAARLPVQTMLRLFGLPADTESHLRRWYDGFEAALSNFARDPVIQAAADAHMAELDAYLQAALLKARAAPSDSLLDQLMDAADGAPLSDEEIRRNAAIIIFGGVSTVEALILNTVWTLSQFPEIEARLRADLALTPRVIEEVLRWQAPVQSATRHVVRDLDFHGHRFRAGQIVNCMLAAANRDPKVMADADRFDIDRTPAPRHLTFAVGRHLCLGMHLARLQAKIAIERLYGRLEGLRRRTGCDATPEGYEFRQPRRLPVIWDRRVEQGGWTG